MTVKKRIVRFLKRVKVRHSTLLLKCVILAAIVVSTAALLALRGSLTETRSQTEELRQQAAALEQENRRLREHIAELGTVRSVQRIAGEKLGLVDPNSAFFTPSTNP